MDEGLLMPDAFPPQVALDLGVAAGVAVLVVESPIDLGGGMPLLGRRGLVVDQDLIDDRVERPQDRSGSLVGPGVGPRFGLGQDPTDLPPGVMKGTRDLADGHAIASSASNRSVIVHRKHILTSARDRVS
jgi:hypothetical protein